MGEKSLSLTWQIPRQCFPYGGKRYYRCAKLHYARQPPRHYRRVPRWTFGNCYIQCHSTELSLEIIQCWDRRENTGKKLCCIWLPRLTHNLAPRSFLRKVFKEDDWWRHRPCCWRWALCLDGHLIFGDLLDREMASRTVHRRVPQTNKLKQDRLSLAANGINLHVT